MSCLGAPTWQQRRIEFNHDWFSRYRKAIAAFREVILGMVVRPDVYPAAFLGQVLPQWESRVSEVVSLLDTFLETMTPALLLREPPLNNLQSRDREWLAPVIDRLWRERIGAERLLALAHRELAQTTDAYARLRRHTHALSPDQTEGLSELAPSLLTFEEAARRLSAALHDFPNTIMVI